MVETRRALAECDPPGDARERLARERPIARGKERQNSKHEQPKNAEHDASVPRSARPITRVMTGPRAARLNPVQQVRGIDAVRQRGSVAIAPLLSAGADDALDLPASLPQASAPWFGAGSPAHRSRSAIHVFTIPILAFTMTDLGVHVAPIRVFTMERSERSRWAGTLFGQSRPE